VGFDFLLSSPEVSFDLLSSFFQVFIITLGYIYDWPSIAGALVGAKSNATCYGKHTRARLRGRIIVHYNQRKISSSVIVNKSKTAISYDWISEVYFYGRR